MALQPHLATPAGPAFAAWIGLRTGKSVETVWPARYTWPGTTATPNTVSAPLPPR